MLKLLFLIFSLSPLGKCKDLSALCVLPSLEDLCAAAELIMVIADIYTSSERMEESVNSPDYDGNEEVIAEISELKERMEKDHLETMTKLELITDLIKNLPVEIKLDHQKELFVSFVTIIDDTFNEFLSALEQKEFTYLKEFGHEFSYGKSRDLDNLRNLLVSPSTVSSVHEGLFSTLTRSLTNGNKVCNGNLSVQETLISLYRMMMKAEIKLYLLLEFFYRNAMKKKDYRKRMKTLSSKANKNILAYSRAVRHSLKTVDEVAHESCDPEDNNWIEDESFYHLEGMHNPAIFKYLERCNGDCSNVLQNSWKCDVSWLHPRVECSEGINYCIPVGTMSVCITKEDKRVISWLETSKLGRAGVEDNSCPSDTALRFDIREGTWTTVPWGACLCYCREKPFIVHSEAMESRVKDNYVVTGVRFIRNSDGVLFLQPQEGKLGVNGEVSDFSWVPLPEVDEANTEEISESQRIIFLDDLRLAHGYVLTGVQFTGFNRGENYELAGFGVSVIGRPYDYKSGKLNLDREYEQLLDASGNDLKELKVNLINPMHTDMKIPNAPSSLDYNYVTLSPSEYADDVEASILPLINAVPVTSEQSPLTGIRLFHKGSEEHAGFISLGVHQAHYVELLDELIEIYAKNGTKIWKAGILKQNIFV